jgi:hypothetical protein
MVMMSHIVNQPPHLHCLPIILLSITYLPFTPAEFHQFFDPPIRRNGCDDILEEALQWISIWIANVPLDPVLLGEETYALATTNVIRSISGGH